MKIVLTTSQAPFIKGGAEFLTNNLKQALIERGYEAEIVSMPFIDSPLHMIENHIVAARLMDLTNTWAGKVDLCIGLKFPAYYIPCDNKVMWVLHQHRAAYDLYNSEFSNIKDTIEGREIRRKIYNADNLYLKEAKRIYTIAENVSNRMKKYNGIDSKPLYHPCPDMDQFYCGDSENYILMPSRINMTKRQKLALEALNLTKTNFKLYVMGKPDNKVVKEELVEYLKSKKLSDRVKFFDYVSQEEKFYLYANARAILFIPLDEDYGYITLEAMAANKPVITAKDSGGPLEFVIDNETGMVVENTPESIAMAMDYYIENREDAIVHGDNARQHLSDMDITWDRVVKELTRL